MKTQQVIIDLSTESDVFRVVGPNGGKIHFEIGKQKPEVPFIICDFIRRSYLEMEIFVRGSECLIRLLTRTSER